MDIATVFVNGFDFGTTKQDLATHMGSVGTVISCEMKQGNATVTFSSAAEANAAVAALNRSVIDGNSRYLDVCLDKKAMPPRPGMKRDLGGGAKAFAGGKGGSNKVFVSGFDFGTSDEQLMAHMSTAGTPTDVHWVSKGSANVSYSSAEEATAAVTLLNKTTMEGNSRFIDVIIGGDRAADNAAKRFKGAGGGAWGGKGAPVVSAFAGKAGKAGKGWAAPVKGKGKSKGGKNGAQEGDHKDEDPAGGGRVFVLGFDYGTSDEQLESHMSQAGKIHTVHWVNKGSAVVVYKKLASAVKAVTSLNTTLIPGNSRYINVTPRYGR